MVMKLYAFTIGNRAAYVSLGVRANSPEEAVNLVRQEFWQQGKTVNEGPTKRLMQQMGAAAGLDPATLDQMKFCEFGIEMPSSRFQLLALKVNPHEITEEHIEWVQDETGTPQQNTRHWRDRG